VFATERACDGVHRGAVEQLRYLADLEELARTPGGGRVGRVEGAARPAQDLGLLGDTGCRIIGYRTAGGPRSGPGPVGSRPRCDGVGRRIARFLRVKWETGLTGGVLWLIAVQGLRFRRPR